MVEEVEDEDDAQQAAGEEKVEAMDVSDIEHDEVEELVMPSKLQQIKSILGTSSPVEQARRPRHAKDRYGTFAGPSRTAPEDEDANDDSFEIPSDFE